MNVCSCLMSVREGFLAATLLLCLISNTIAAKCCAPPRKLSISDDKRIHLVSEGYPYMLRCPVEASSSNYVDWSRSNLSSLYMEDGFKITSRGVLKVINVTKNHGGSYTCHVTNGYGTVDVNLTLIVDDSDTNSNTLLRTQNTTGRQLGIAPSFKKKESITVSEEVGKSVTLHCVTSGHPSPIVFWLKEGVWRSEAGVRKMQSTLRIEDLKKSDAGIYRCIAKNIIGEAHLDFTLQVTDLIGPPTILALVPLSATVKTDLIAAFSCEVTSKPGLNLHIKWFKALTDDEMRESKALDDITLFRSNSLFYRPLNISQSYETQDGVYRSKIIIQRTEEEDTGTYVCFALNDKGFVFKNATLNVIKTEMHVSRTQNDVVLNGLSFVMPIIILMVALLALAVKIVTLRRKIVASRTRITSEVPATCAEREGLKDDVATVPRGKCDDKKSVAININSKATQEYSENKLQNVPSVQKLIII